MIDISYFQIDMLMYQIFLLSFLDDNQFLYTVNRLIVFLKDDKITTFYILNS